ncbi:MAG: CIA30 family protein [Rhodospirillales bacterium]
MADGELLVDDFSRDDGRSALGTIWRGVSDRVMGGVSRETVAVAAIDGRRCLRLTGDVRLDNGGGFIQMALDLAVDGGAFDAKAYRGLALEVYGNDEKYGVHLRSSDCIRPWQSYRADFVAEPRWRRITLPFDSFAPHRLAPPLDVCRLRRLGLVAIGRAFTANLAVARLTFHAEDT